MFVLKIGLVLLSVLVLPFAASAQQAAQQPLPPVQTSCESRLAVWQENGRNFISQILELEAQNRELRLHTAKLTQERDAAVAKVKPEEKQSKVTEEK